MSTELLPIESVNAVDLFTGQKMDDLLDKIATHVRNQSVNATTDKGRTEIKSLARKVASSKVAIDNAGKDLVADLKKQTSAIDAARKRARDFLDRLRDEARQPVTEWEEAEDKRIESVANFFDMVRKIKTIPHGCSAKTISDSIVHLDAVSVDPDLFLERSEEATETVANARAFLVDALALAEKAEADALELEKLRAAETARLAKEAAEAEERAAKEAAAERERLAKEAADRAEAEARRREEAAAENARIEAKRQADEALAKAEHEKQEAIAKAEAEKQALIDEQARVEAERIAAQEREAAEQAKREANKKHRAKLTKEAVHAIDTLSLVDAETAGLIVTAIAEGKIPHIKMEF